VPCSPRRRLRREPRGAARDARHRSDRRHALPGFGVPAAQVPANVQAVTGEEIARQHPLNLPEFMSQRLPGVNVNENQSKPLSARRHLPRVQRFASARHASGDLGVPGRRAHQRAVRRHGELGSDPGSAISTINLIPGSNPLFGLKHASAARCSIRTKSGAQYPGNGGYALRRFVRPAARQRRSTAARTASSIILRARAHFARTDGARSRLPTCASFFPSSAGMERNERSRFGHHPRRSDLTGNGCCRRACIETTRNRPTR